MARIYKVEPPSHSFLAQGVAITMHIIRSAPTNQPKWRRLSLLLEFITAFAEKTRAGGRAPQICIRLINVCARRRLTTCHTALVFVPLARERAQFSLSVNAPRLQIGSELRLITSAASKLRAVVKKLAPRGPNNSEMPNS
jgi:hypothetical protein